MLYNYCGRMVCRLLSFLSVVPSVKSTKFGRLTEGALLYIRAKIGKLWPTEVPLGARILKGVKKICAFVVGGLAERDKIWQR